MDSSSIKFIIIFIRFPYTFIAFAGVTNSQFLFSEILRKYCV